MKILRTYGIMFTILMIAVVACKKQLHPAVITASNSYLVVNGFINNGDSTTINLSRTVKVSDSASSVPELNATVIIEGSGGFSYTLASKGNGNYMSAVLNLASSQNYRLKIITNNGKQYLSGYVPVKNSPAIDSVNYVVQNNGVQINASSHDGSGNTRYYKWDYKETFLIHPEFAAQLMHFTNPDTILTRPVDKQIDTCWQTVASTSINVGSSVRLSQDIIALQAITFVSSTSDKLGYLYSIEVTQYAVTPENYNYLQLLQKNTEQIGGIFDAQPSSLTGNIHSVSDSREPVIGFVGCGSITKKRIFIYKRNLPAWQPVDKYSYCDRTADTNFFINPHTAGHDVAEYLYTDFRIPLSTIYAGSDTTKIIGYIAVSRECADCTTRGTNIRPAYWPK